VALGPQPLEQLACRRDAARPFLDLVPRQIRPPLADERHAAVHLRLRGEQPGRQVVVVIDRQVRELPHDLEPSGGLELGVEIFDQEADQFFGVGTRFLRGEIRLMCAVIVDPPEHRARDRNQHQHGADRRKHAGAHQDAVRLGLALALRSQLAFRLVARFAFVAQVAARCHHAAQHVVRELDATHVESLLDAQQPPVHQLGERIRRGPHRRQRLHHALLGETLAVARLGEQLVLDHPPHAGRLVNERALVELGKNRLA
jgi:hypothetical protein